MRKIEILLIGRHPQIMETVLRLINQNENWNAVGALTDEEAVEKFHRYNFQLVLLGGGIEEASERKLRSLFTFHDPEIIIIQHYGGGSGLLSNEIMEALDKKAKQDKPIFHFKDGI
jgi:DNA-binding NarL/FixJ family response regulator